MPALLPPAVSPVLCEPRRALAAAILPVAGLEASRDRYLVVRRYHVSAAVAQEKLGGTPRWRQREDPGLELHVLEDLGGNGHVTVLRQAQQHCGIREELHGLTQRAGRAGPTQSLHPGPRPGRPHQDP